MQLFESIEWPFGHHQYAGLLQQMSASLGQLLGRLMTRAQGDERTPVCRMEPCDARTKGRRYRRR